MGHLRILARPVLLYVVTPLFLLVLVFSIEGPATRSDTLKVTGRDKKVHTISYLTARPLLPVPFLNDGSSGSISYRGRSERLHPSGWGHRKGPTLFSPDGNKVVVMKQFEGSLRGGLLIDLTTGTIDPVEQSRSQFEAGGWQQIHWESSW
jgi:hypothetical protein